MAAPAAASPNLDISSAAVREDSTTLSPQEKLARRDSLEKSLQHRPDAQQLKDRHILLDTTAAPSLQAAQVELDRQRRTDELKKGLSQRPEREELVERNILPTGNSSVAPSLASAQRDLQRQMRHDSLDKALAARPSPADLVREGILERDEIPEGVLVDEDEAK